MAWNIGANDVANAMGTSVGSGALTLRRAVLCAAVLEFAGAYFVGMHVTDTVRKGIINTELFAGDTTNFMLGMLAALLAAGVWLQIASYFGWPVSTTHSIVGAIVGFGVVYKGVDAVEWFAVGRIVSSWVVSPLLAGFISFVIFRILHKQIFRSAQPVLAAKRITPYLVFLVFVILTFVMIFKGLKQLKLDLPLGQATAVACGIGLIAAFISAFLVRYVKTDGVRPIVKSFNESSMSRAVRKARKHLRRIKHQENDVYSAEAEEILASLDGLSEKISRQQEDAAANQPPLSEEASQHAAVEKIFVYLQILSACFVAFAHGANDVANAVGPLAAVISTAREGVIMAQSTVDPRILLLGGVGIVIGLATWGWRVIETIGKRITELTPTRGFAAEFGAATTIVLASKLHLPISTTHTLVGAVLGVGLARGISALNLNTLRDIVISWVVTLPAGAALAIVFFYALKMFFGS
ncbi:inorganic phosphate transporter [bacterium AH-315-I18]|nr:inorganic phosphate transporter [bacterium AH-315-I18]